MVFLLHGFSFCYGWESEKIFEGRLSLLEEELKKGGEEALEELKLSWHKVDVTKVSKKKLLEKLRSYDLAVIMFPPDDWKGDYAEITVRFRDHFLDLRGPQRIEKYFSILDKFTKNKQLN